MGKDMKKPRFSICIPYYSEMENGGFLLNRCLASIEKQTYRDYEIVLTLKGKMAENTNVAIRQARGEIIKILFADDFFMDKNSLAELAALYDSDCSWVASGCMHKLGNEPLFNPHLPQWTTDIITGNNRIGSPSVISFKNDNPPLFDETMDWMLDCDFYQKLHERYGEPTYLRSYNVVIGIGPHQMTNKLSTETKLKEADYMRLKYE